MRNEKRNLISKIRLQRRMPKENSTREGPINKADVLQINHKMVQQGCKKSIYRGPPEPLGSNVLEALTCEERATSGLQAQFRYKFRDEATTPKTRSGTVF